MQILTDTKTNTITIKQKRPYDDTNSIHDLASVERDRVIRMGEIFQYAVVPPGHATLRITRHIIFTEALKRYRSLVRRGFKGTCVFDRTGALVNDPRLYRIIMNQRSVV